MWNTGNRAGGFRGMGETFHLAKGFNDLSDVAATAHLITKGPGGGFGKIAHDFVNTVIGPWSFEGMGTTFYLLR